MVSVVGSVVRGGIDPVACVPRVVRCDLRTHWEPGVRRSLASGGGLYFSRARHLRAVSWLLATNRKTGREHWRGVVWAWQEPRARSESTFMS